MMQYTFGDMIGELFMKALTLEEQRKVREEEKSYKNEVMQYQRGRDQVSDQRYTSDKNTSDQRYKDAYGLQLAQNQREIDQNNRMEIDTRINRRSKLTPLDQALITKYKLNPENYPTGEGWEKEFQDPNIFADPKLESQRYILDDELARLNDSWYKDQTLRRMGNGRREDQKKWIYKVDPTSGKLLERLFTTDQQLANTYLNPNDPNFETNKNYMFTDNPQAGLLMGNTTQPPEGKVDIKTKEGRTVQVMTAKSNEFITKLLGLPQKGGLLSALMPSLISKTSRSSMPSFGSVDLGSYTTPNIVEDASTLDRENRDIRNKKQKENAYFFDGLLNQTINPLLEVIREMKGLDVATEIELGFLFPKLKELYPAFDKGLVSNENGRKDKFYNAYKEAEKYYKKHEGTILAIATQNALDAAAQQENSKDKKQGR